MKILLWIGNKSNQRALANKINDVYPLSGIIIEDRHIKPKITFDKMVEKMFLSSISNAWKNMQAYYNDLYPRYPSTKTLTISNINSEEAYNFTTELNPDLIIVSGTRLIKEKMLSIKPSIGILNLHTGISPYVKGGPNSTNWCIANKELHLIGNTIMWIDLGIDTGNIVTTETTEFSGDENLTQVHIKVMEHGHHLYLKAIEALTKGMRPSVNQDTIAKGTTYTTKQWRFKQKLSLLLNFKNFKKNIRSADYAKQKEKIITIKL